MAQAEEIAVQTGKPAEFRTANLLDTQLEASFIAAIDMMMSDVGGVANQQIEFL